MRPTAHDAIQIASTWLEGHRDGMSGYRGAYVAGSVARLADGDALPEGSDVDVMVVGREAGYLGKAFAAGIVIEGTVLEAATVFDPEAVLRDYHLAPGLVHARILDDPQGEIARVQASVLERYADPDTIMARLNHVEERVRATLASALVDGRTETDRITAWQFGVGQIAHMILVAALENPTVRKRYVLASQVLGRIDEDVAYERLLRLARFNRLRPTAVEAAMQDLDELLVVAGPVADGCDWRFASDISTPMRPVVMDGIRAMIAEGWHREAMFWLVATWCRCVQLLERDVDQRDPPAITAAVTGPGLPEDPVPDMARLRGELRVETGEDMVSAVEEAREAIPAFRALAERIVRRGR